MHIMSASGFQESIMLKKSPSRNQRSKGFKTKHALQICVLLAICIWLLYFIRQTNKKKSALEKISRTAKVTNGHTILKLGRKGLDPEPEEIAANFIKHDDEAGHTVGLGVTDKDENGVTDAVIDRQDQEKAKEELEDFIDEDEYEESSISETDSYGDDVELFSTQHHFWVERNFDAAKEGTL